MTLKIGFNSTLSKVDFEFWITYPFEFRNYSVEQAHNSKLRLSYGTNDMLMPWLVHYIVSDRLYFKWTYWQSINLHSCRYLLLDIVVIILWAVRGLAQKHCKQFFTLPGA